MKLLALDTSCDESCAAILDTDSWKLLADVVHSHVSKMEAFGGVVPEIASREHLKALPLAVEEALRLAGLSYSDLDWIAVTNRPGLIGALMVGVSYGKALAYSLQKPFTAIDHIEAHLYSPMLTTLDGKEAPPFPWIALVVSGGHSELFHVRGIGDYTWLGGTLDDAAGEAFDKIGKCLGLGYPAGPVIDKWVREEATEDMFSKVKFPRSLSKAHYFSFSGLKTSVLNEIKGRTLDKKDLLTIAASAQDRTLGGLSK